MRFTGAVGGRGQVEFSPAVVSGRARSGAVRPGAGAGVSTERTRAAGAAAGPAWLRALAAAGPWLRWPAGRCRTSGSSRAGAHGPGGSGSSHPSPVPARARAAPWPGAAARAVAGSAASPLRCSSSPCWGPPSRHPPPPKPPSASSATPVKRAGTMEVLTTFDHAQAFTTGANAAGYTLTGVDIDFYAYSGDNSYPVSIWTEVSGSPGVSVGNLTSPSSLTDTALNSYTTSGIDLAASTTYFVHVDSSSGALANCRLENTASATTRIREASPAGALQTAAYIEPALLYTDELAMEVRAVTSIPRESLHQGLREDSNHQHRPDGQAPPNRNPSYRTRLRRRPQRSAMRFRPPRSATQTATR